MIREHSKGEQGQALVEMALILPLLFLLLFGVIEMGRVGYAYVSISNATREGGRLATIGGTDLEIKSSIENATPSLDSANLTITIFPSESNRQSGQEVKVNVTYPVHLVIPIINGVIANPVVVSSSIVMRLE